MGDGAGRQTGCCCVPTPAPNIRVTSSPIADRLLRCQRTPLRVCTLGVDCRSFLLRRGTEGSNPSPSSEESCANPAWPIGSDRSQLARVATQAKAALQTDTLEAVADRGYFNGEEIVAANL
jgi:hypothetical protein